MQTSAVAVGFCFFYACSTSDEPSRLTAGNLHAVRLGGEARELRISSPYGSWVARREIEFELVVSGSPQGLPAELLLSADMTHMAHGPAHSRLRREGNRYAGIVVFVMGGLWELEIRDEDRLVLKGQITVLEN